MSPNAFNPRVPKPGIAPPTARATSCRHRRLRRRTGCQRGWGGARQRGVPPHAPGWAGLGQTGSAAVAALAFSLPASLRGKGGSERCPGSAAAPYGAQRAPSRKRKGRCAAHAAVPVPYLAVRGGGSECAPPAWRMRGGSRGRGWAGDREINSEQADLIINVRMSNYIM